MDDFQSILKLEFTASPNISVIQKMTPNDQASVYGLCTTICYPDDIDSLLDQHSEILADKIIGGGGYLLNSSNNFNHCLVMNNFEDALRVFVLTTNESEKYGKMIRPTWITQLHKKIRRLIK